MSENSSAPNTQAFKVNADDKDAIRQKLEGADIVPLTMSLVHLTGDLSLLALVEPHVRGAWSHQESVPPELSSMLRDRMASELVRIQSGGAPALANPSASVIQRMMSVAVGEAVPEEYVPMLIEHTGMEEDAKSARRASDSIAEKSRIESQLKVVIIGAGASGIAAAVKLAEEDIAFTIFEKNEDVGGTWFENRYPGCAVDTPNHFYQFSFEPNNDWPNYFSSQPNIREYLSRCVDKYHLRKHIRFAREVESAIYDDVSKTWTVAALDKATGKTESLTVNAVICAVGQLNRPMVPNIPGLGDFKGQVLHTADWPTGTDLSGKRVALVGTGASAVQVGPAIANQVESMHVFQRSGAWVMRRPNIDRAVSQDTKWALNTVPLYAAWYRFQLFWAFGDGLFEALKIDPEWKGGNESISAMNAKLREMMVKHIRKELEGREDLIAKVIPDYPPFGKRVLGDAGWFKMLRRDNVTLNDSGIDHIGEHSITAKDGAVAEVDAIVMATGFHAGRMLWPMDIKGRSGKSIRETWGDDNPRAFLGISAVDYPNLFIMYGPNTNLGHGGSAIFLAECQTRYIVKLLVQMRDAHLRSVEIRKDVHDEYNAEIDLKLKELAWSHPSVNTWYKNSDGRIVTNQPWRLVDYWRLTSTPKLDDYVVA